MTPPCYSTCSWPPVTLDASWPDMDEGAFMANMRHRLVHGYADVNLDIVWAVVDGELPELIGAVLPLIPNEEPS